MTSPPTGSDLIVFAPRTYHAAFPVPDPSHAP
jgi:hypothetical protein